MDSYFQSKEIKKTPINHELESSRKTNTYFSLYSSTASGQHAKALTLIQLG